jgi:hypothetical protein
VTGAAPPSAPYPRGSSSVPASDQSALAKPRAETTRMMVSSRASRAAVTAALNRIPATASAVAAASRTSAAVRGLTAGQTAFRYWPAARAKALGTMTNSVSCRARARKPARRPRTRATIPYRPPAVGYSAPSSAQPTAQAGADQGRDQEGEEGAAALLAQGDRADGEHRRRRPDHRHGDRQVAGHPQCPGKLLLVTGARGRAGAWCRIAHRGPVSWPGWSLGEPSSPGSRPSSRARATASARVATPSLR